LKAEDEQPAPASTMYVDRAPADGRRATRLRRLAVVGSAAVVLAVAGVVGAITAGRPSGIGPGPGPAATPSIPDVPPGPTGPAVVRAPDTFDPMIQYADFGWLPGGEPDRLGLGVGTDWLRIDASFGVTAARKDQKTVTLGVVSAGHGIAPGRASDFVTNDPDWVDDIQYRVTGEAADPVNERRAMWAPDWAMTTLAWEYAPRAWAMVTVSGDWGGEEGARAAARRIATHVRFGLDRPIRLPFTVRGLPGSLKPQMVSTVVGPMPGWWGAGVQFGSTTTRPLGGDWPLTVNAYPMDHRSDAWVAGGPDSTLDGHPSRISEEGPTGGEALQVFDLDGAYLEIFTNGPDTVKSLDGGLKGLFRATAIHPDPADWR
jgi:hypothetical protein